MQSSKYNVLVRQNGCGYVFNSRRETVTVVSLPLLEAIEQSNLGRIPTTSLALLLRNGILVADGEDETQKVQAQILSRRVHHDLRLIVIPTYFCNLTCSYCYAQGVTSQATSEPEDWEQNVIRFIKQRLTAKKEKRLTLAFFGGEPLVKAGQCLSILKQAHQLMADYKGTIYSTLTTNGSIYNRQVAELLKRIDFCQITLDGIDREHDRHRRFKNGRGSFRKILTFLKSAVAVGCKTAVRFHLHDYDRDYLRTCALRLLEELGAESDLSIYFSKVVAGCYSEIMKCSPQKELVEAGVEPHQIARDVFEAAGWPVDRLYLHSKGNSTVSCAARCGYIGTESFLLDFKNKIFFCPVALNNPNLQIGTINQGRSHFFPLRDQLLSTFSLAGKCKDCSLLPLCEQGCPTKVLVNTQGSEPVFCEKEQILSNIRKRCESTKL